MAIGFRKKNPVLVNMGGTYESALLYVLQIADTLLRKTFEETQNFEKGRKSKSSNMKTEIQMVLNNQEF